MDHLKQSDEYWRKKLSPEQYRVCRQKGTEPAFSGKYYAHKDKGIYQCVSCGASLFDSNTKFNSGTGWPSFFAPTQNEVIQENQDVSHGMQRIEVTCKKCGSHLGHVFDDGPKPTGKRYCINSVALNFRSKKR